MDFLWKLIDIDSSAVLDKSKLAQCSREELEQYLLRRQAEWQELSTRHNDVQTENQSLKVELSSLKRKMAISGRQQKMQRERDMQIINALKDKSPELSEDPLVSGLQNEIKHLAGSESALQEEVNALQQKLELLQNELKNADDRRRQELESYEKKVSSWKKIASETHESDQKMIVELKEMLKKDSGPTRVCKGFGIDDAPPHNRAEATFDKKSTSDMAVVTNLSDVLSDQSSRDAVHSPQSSEASVARNQESSTPQELLLRQRLLELEQENALLRAQDAGKKLENVEEQKRDLEVQLQQLQNEMASLKTAHQKEMESVSWENIRIEKELSSVKDLLREKVREFDKLTEASANSSRLAERKKQDELRKMQLKIEQLSGAHQQETVGLRKQIEDLEAELQIVKYTTDTFENQRTPLKNTLEQRNEQHSPLVEGSVPALESEVKRLRESSKFREEAIDRFVVENEELRGQLRDLEDRLATASIELHNREVEVAERERERLSLLQRLNTIGNDCKALTDQLRELESERDQSRREYEFQMAETAKELESKTVRIDELTVQIINLQAQTNQSCSATDADGATVKSVEVNLSMDNRLHAFEQRIRKDERDRVLSEQQQNRNSEGEHGRSWDRPPLRDSDASVASIALFLFELAGKLVRWLMETLISPVVAAASKVDWQRWARSPVRCRFGQTMKLFLGSAFLLCMALLVFGMWEADNPNAEVLPAGNPP